MNFTTRLKRGFNAFFNKDPTSNYNDTYDYGGYYAQPYRAYSTHSTERSVVGAIYNRLALDTAHLKFRHAQLDDNGQYTGDIQGELNNRLTLSANEDQTATAMIFDAVMTMFEYGNVALVPVHTDVSPWTNDTFNIWEIRVGYVTKWKPHEVTVKVYNGDKGQQEEIRMPKSACCLIQNPFHTIMNEPTSDLKRLIQKMNLLDQIDVQSASTKLNLLVQLPYNIRTEKRRQEAKQRTESLEDQLTGSKYGIGYIDATEKVTQLGRPIESTIPDEIDKLTTKVYSMFGLTPEIMNGTADEQTMLNYYSRTIEPIACSLTDEMTRKWLSKNARTRGQAVIFYRDIFKLVPLSSIADIANNLITSEVVSANEVRSMIGLKPSSDPRADQLLNPNINPADSESQDLALSQEPEDGEYVDEDGQEVPLDEAESVQNENSSVPDEEYDYPEPKDEDTAAFIEEYKRLLKGVKQ